MNDNTKKVNIDKYHSNLIKTASSLRNKQDWEAKYPFYVLWSDEPIENIREIIDKIHKNIPGREVKPTGLIKAIKSKGFDTDRTLCVVDENVYSEMRKQGYHIDYFIPNHFDLPKEHETRNLYIDLPAIPQLSKLSTCQQYLNSRMGMLVMYGIWKKEDFKISYPQKSRENNVHSGKAFIVFHLTGKDEEEKIDILNRITLTRNFLNGVYWSGTGFKVHCNWARKSKKRVESEDKSDDSKFVLPVFENKQKEKDDDGFSIPKYHNNTSQNTPVVPVTSAWSKPLVISSDS